jgi:hypothetical protein
MAQIYAAGAYPCMNDNCNRNNKAPCTEFNRVDIHNLFQNFTDLELTHLSERGKALDEDAWTWLWRIWQEGEHGYCLTCGHPDNANGVNATSDGNHNINEALGKCTTLTVLLK